MRNCLLHPDCRRGLSLVETVISALVVVGVMGVLVVISGSLRADDGHQRTLDALDTLNVALQTYAARHAGDALPTDTAEVVRTLRQDPATQPLVAHLPTAPTAAGVMLLDGYSRPMRYRPPTGGSAIGDFVSAGPDGQFGVPDGPRGEDRRATTDNLYGAERLGFTRPTPGIAPAPGSAPGIAPAPGNSPGSSQADPGDLP